MIEYPVSISQNYAKDFFLSLSNSGTCLYQYQIAACMSLSVLYVLHFEIIRCKNGAKTKCYHVYIITILITMFECISFLHAMSTFSIVFIVTNVPLMIIKYVFETFLG